MEENGIAPLTWEGKRSAAAAPDAEVVDKPTRRRFSPSYKLRVVEEADRKARNRLRAAFRWCVGQGYISTNPVDRAVAALPKVNGNGTTHHRALPHGEVPAALRRSARRDVGRNRHGGEGLDDPAGENESRSGASRAAVQRRASELAGDSPFVFPTRAGRALSSKSTYRVLQLAGVTGTTLHGFRTSIRVWMAETGVDRETAEAVLAHVVLWRLNREPARLEQLLERLIIGVLVHEGLQEQIVQRY